MEVEIITLSKQGGRDYNEDVVGQWNDGRFVACLVADGAGGHGGGDVAAAIARASVLRGFSENPGIEPDLLQRLIVRANLDIVARQAEGGTLAAMRSTVVLAVVDLHENQIAWAHSGDSRAYLFRGGALVARTVDHSLVQQMVAGGMLDEEGARHHPQRNMLLSALGSVDAAPDIVVSAPMPLAPGDVLLLCTDGVWEPLGDACLLTLLQAAGNATQWMEAIDQQIRSTAKPGHDNYTALTLWAQPDGQDGPDEEVTRLLPP